jgi:hypothetical protein
MYIWSQLHHTPHRDFPLSPRKDSKPPEKGITGREAAIKISSTSPQKRMDIDRGIEIQLTRQNLQILDKTRNRDGVKRERHVDE